MVDLLLRFWCQIERQARGITAGPYHSRGVIGHAGAVQEGKFTARQMVLAAVRIQEQWLTIAGERQFQGHRIHRDIPTLQISLQRAALHHRVFARSWVMLLPRPSEIEQDAIEGQLSGAVGIVDTNILHPLVSVVPLQRCRQIGGRAFQYQIQIRQVSPWIAVLIMQQGITDSTAHKS